MPAIAPTQSNIQAAVNAFLGVVLPGVLVVSGQDNRVAEPTNGSFIVMTPIRFERIATNLDVAQDCRFVGSISGATLTASSLIFGVINVGDPVFGAGVAPGTVVTALGTGSGGVGTYTVSISQTVASATLGAGTEAIVQSAQATVQLDFHSADLTGGDMAQTFVTAWRDEYAVDFLAALAPPLNIFSPLYTEDPRQIPFINENQQYEWRWVVDALLQVNQTVIVPQQYADSVTVNVINVQAAYGP